MKEYQVEIFIRDFMSGERISCGKYKTPIEDAVLCVDLPKEKPELSRIEIEFSVRSKTKSGRLENENI